MCVCVFYIYNMIRLPHDCVKPPIKVLNYKISCLLSSLFSNIVSANASMRTFFYIFTYSRAGGGAAAAAEICLYQPPLLSPPLYACSVLCQFVMQSDCAFHFVFHLHIYCCRF